MNRLSFLAIALFLGGIYLTTAKIGNQTGPLKINKLNGYRSIVTDLYDPSDSLLAESISRGKNIYMANCLSCHMMNGEGIPGTFPPLAKSDYLMADSVRAIQTTLYGQKETIMVNGVKYQSPSHSFSHLTDEQVADVMNYIRNSWGNNGGIITPELIAGQRKEE